MDPTSIVATQSGADCLPSIMDAAYDSLRPRCVLGGPTDHARDGASCSQAVRDGGKAP